jgi:hypothetical protein
VPGWGSGAQPPGDGGVTRRLLGILVVVLALIATACSGDDSNDSSETSVADTAGQPLRLDAMDAAVDAVQAALGGEQHFYEVNATPTLVNLFVAGADGNELSYVYDAVEKSLGDQVAQAPTMTQTFTWSQVDFDPDQVLTQALGALPSSLPRLFSVTAGDDSGLFYVVTLESTQGGILDVLVDRKGEILSTRAS